MYEAFRNVNFALHELTNLMVDTAVTASSRNGPVMTMDFPIMVATREPTERVLLCPTRRANPFLFLLDGLSILSCVDLVKPLADISPRFLQYSDDGLRLRGHYGARLRPQIDIALDMLRKDPNNRRVALSIWDRAKDLGADSVDIPCNVMVIPRIISIDVLDDDEDEFVPKPALDLTVLNRSNDLYWGMLGANIVQFSFLQEFLARSLGIEVGTMYQVTTNLHVYTEMGPGKNLKGASLDDEDWVNPFSEGSDDYPPVVPLDTTDLLTDLDMMFLMLAEEKELPSTRNYFLNTVVYPMLRSWKEKSPAPLEGYPDCDWFHAARMWWSK